MEMIETAKAIQYNVNPRGITIDGSPMVLDLSGLLSNGGLSLEPKIDYPRDNHVITKFNGAILPENDDDRQLFYKCESLKIQGDLYSGFVYLTSEVYPSLLRALKISFVNINNLSFKFVSFGPGFGNVLAKILSRTSGTKRGEETRIKSLRMSSVMLAPDDWIETFSGLRNSALEKLTLENNFFVTSSCDKPLSELAYALLGMKTLQIVTFRAKFGELLPYKNVVKTFEILSYQKLSALNLHHCGYISPILLFTIANIIMGYGSIGIRTLNLDGVNVHLADANSEIFVLLRSLSRSTSLKEFGLFGTVFSKNAYPKSWNDELVRLANKQFLRIAPSSKFALPNFSLTWISSDYK